MKNYRAVILLFAIIAFVGCFGNGSRSAGGSGGEMDSTQIVFDKEMYDFGVLESLEPVACMFGFTNTGKAPLLIQDVVAGCGCTNVKYPLKPLAAGAKGSIEITFNPRGQQGHQRKIVTVSSNGSKEPQVLIIRANVQPSSNTSK
ncbi:MAG: DUF1573 domain-containing protein [Cytophagaceae bacterium]|jgi:hypothetical protein|nr:DUF1573 domain-containing protein [Cytophagaceae bacterium]